MQEKSSGTKRVLIFSTSDKNIVRQDQMVRALYARGKNRRVKGGARRQKPDE
jgi:hypothetical protein